MTWTLAEIDTTIAARFEQVARTHAGRQAIGGTRWSPTYAELDAAADDLARTIVERCGPGPGRVALLMAHDAPQFAAALGALKAGKTVVALGLGDPPARIEQILRDTGAQLVLADERNRPRTTAGVLVVADRPASSGRGAPGIAVEPDRPAFIITTSGSTGAPKGVVQTHRTMLHNVLRHSNGLGIGADDRMALLGPLSGGQGVGTTWTALLNGAALCPFPIADRGVAGLAGWIDHQAITVLPASASVFRSFARTLGDRRFESVRLVRLGSEPAFRADLEAFGRHFSDGARLANTLSASETGNIARAFFEAGDEIADERLPAGRAVDGIEIALLDAGGEEASSGEIVVRSAFLSPGYWNDAARTAERFADGTYRTGDLGRRSADGLLTVLGRVDHQVKIHGHRVELGDVEAALAALPGVASAAVAPVATARGEVKLTGYVVTGGARSAAAVRDGLRATLPTHAVPTAFAFVDALPLNDHGKVDRASLGRLAVPAVGASPAPAGATEARVAALWADALGAPRIGRDEGFLDLGGDSLAAAEVAAGIRDAFGLEYGLRDFAANPSVAAMAARIDADDGGTRPPPPPLTKGPPGEPAPLSFAQERVWRSTRTLAGRLGQNVAGVISIRGDLHVGAFRAALDHAAARHDVLRTTFTPHGDTAVAHVGPPRPLGLPLTDLRRLRDPEARALQILARDLDRPFDLARGPLVVFELLRVGDDEHWLLRRSHHLISDGPSWTLLFEETGAAYEAILRGDEPAPADPDAPQYADVARRQRRDAALRHEQLAWWRDLLREPHKPLALPFVRTTPPAAPPPPGVHWWGLPAATIAALDALGREANATYAMVRAATFTAMLALEAGTEDVAVGMPVSNRRDRQTQSIFGDFSNVVALRMRFAAGRSFRGWLGDVRAALLETTDRIDVPWAHVVEDLLAHGIAPPELRVMFQRSYQTPPMRFGGLRLDRVRAPRGGGNTGFNFLVDPWYEADRNVVTFDSNVYDPDLVAAFADRFVAFCTAVADRPDRSLDAVVR